MVLKNTTEPLRREKLGGCGNGAADTFPVAIPDQDGVFIAYSAQNKHLDRFRLNTLTALN